MAAPNKRYYGILSHDLVLPVLLALGQLALQMSFHKNYGYFRDELYYIACSDHLAFGYVDQPPLSIVILWLNRWLLGDSLLALRFLPALAGAIVVVLTAAAARRLGGSRFAQGLAALAVFAAHGLIGQGKTFSMNPFDVLFWALAGYIVISIFVDDNPKLWIPFGLVVGLGLLNKYSVGFMVMGLVAGLLLTRQRRQLAFSWFWLGAGIAFIFFLPHILWQVANHFPSLEFMRNASQHKNVNLGLVDFLLGQLRDMNILNAPLWLGGIYFFFTQRQGRFRPLAWMYLFVLMIMVVGHGKVYYLYAIYPIFLAAGAVWFEQVVQPKTALWLKPLYVTLLILVAIVILPFALPVLPVEKFIAYEHVLGMMPHAEERSAVAELPQYYADQFGWQEMVGQVASVYNKLTPEEQAHCFIYVRNYGEAAAIDFFGKAQSLPRARCGHNNYWLWGPGKETGTIAIIFGHSRNLEDNYADLRRCYQHVELVAVTDTRYAMPFENGRMIFLCRGMNTTFQELWAKERFYI